MGGYWINRAYNRAIEDIYFGMGGAGETSVLFGRLRIPAMNAAFVNATYAHGADMDDGDKRAMGHIGAPAISAVLAFGKAIGSTEQELLTAINVGYEVFCRAGGAAQPGLVRRGFYVTGTAGAVAAAAACVKLFQMRAPNRYPAHRFVDAMAFASTQASGLMLITRTGR